MITTTYKEIESGVIQRTDIDGETTTSYRPVKVGDTRTDTDDEGNETITDCWQEAIDAGAVMLSDEQITTRQVENENARLDAAIERIESRAINALINFALDPSPTKRSRLQSIQDKIEEKLALKV